MPMAIDLIKIGLLMSHEFHHASQILVLVVTSIEFQLSIATDEHQRGAVGAHPIEGRILVDCRL